jgi:hypothetical protein
MGCNTPAFLLQAIFTTWSYLHLIKINVFFAEIFARPNSPAPLLQAIFTIWSYLTPHKLKKIKCGNLRPPPNKPQHLPKPKRIKRQLALPFIKQSPRPWLLRAHPGQRNSGQGLPDTPTPCLPSTGRACQPFRGAGHSGPQEAAGPRKTSGANRYQPLAIGCLLCHQ